MVTCAKKLPATADPQGVLAALPVIRPGFQTRTNLCYHGTGSEERAREGVRGQQKGISMPEHCNVYDTGDRMQLTQ